MKPISNEELIKQAKSVAKLHISIANEIKTGEVGAALITNKRNLYVGASIGADCGIGFCAESSAIAAMVTAGEHSIKKIVAITSNGTILPPCGRCREIIYQINILGLKAQVFSLPSVFADGDRCVVGGCSFVRFVGRLRRPCVRDNQRSRSVRAVGASEILVQVQISRERLSL